jgi:hypothetical protein
MHRVSWKHKKNSSTPHSRNNIKSHYFSKFKHLTDIQTLNVIVAYVTVCKRLNVKGLEIAL